MEYGNILIIVGFVLVLIIIVNFTVSKKVVKNNMEKNILDTKDDTVEEKQRLNLGVGAGFKFGFGFGLGVLVLGFLVTVILTFAGFSLTRVLFRG